MKQRINAGTFELVTNNKSLSIRDFGQMLPSALSARRATCAILLLTAMATVPWNVEADTLAVWKGGNGLWSDPSSWSTGSVPNNGNGSAYSVAINSGTVIVNPGMSSSAPITIDSLTVGGALQSQFNSSYASQTLNVTGNVVNAGSIQMDRYFRNFNVGGNLINSGSLTAQGLAISGNLTNTGQLDVLVNYDSPTGLDVVGTLNNAGDIQLGSLYGNAQVTVGRLQGSGGLILMGGSTITLTAQPQGITTVNGFVELDRGSSIFAGSRNAFSNLTTINGAMSLYLGSPFSVTPLGPTHTLTINNSLNFSDGSAMDVNGNVLINGGFSIADDEHNLGASRLTATGTITNNGSVYTGGFYSRGDPIRAAGFVNHGLVQMIGGSTMVVRSLTNSGTISLSGPSSSLLVGTGSVAAQFSGFESFNNGRLTEMINGSSSFGEIKTTGAADLSGILDIVEDSSYVAAPGTTFLILTFAPGELSGVFSQVIYGSNNPFSITYDNHDGEVYLTALAANPVPEPTTCALFGLSLASLTCWISRTRSGRR